MLIIEVEKIGNLDRALKSLKRKFQSTGVIDELRERKEYKKKSVKRRDVVNKAIWREAKRREE